jgi:hypothetical protein
MAILVAGSKVGSVVNEQCQCLRCCVSLGSEMERRSAAWAARVDIRAMCDQPGNRALCPLKCKGLQRSSATRLTAVHWLTQRQEILGDVVCFLAVSLKMAECRHQFRAAGNCSMVEQPAGERKVPGSPAGAEQGCRVADPPIDRGHVHFGPVPVEYFGYSHLSSHVLWSMGCPV